MCTYLTEHLVLRAQAKGPGGWFAANEASVYFDHPVSLGVEHSLNLDLLSSREQPRRLAVELDAASALDLARGILTTLARSPDTLVPAEVLAAARRAAEALA